MRRARHLPLAVALVACHAARDARPRPSGLPLVTTAEQSGWVRTGRYDEALRLCHDFAATYDGVTCREIGRTLEHRPIVALFIDRAPGKPTIYVQAGVHAGEIEGKDAGYWFVRDLLDGRVAPGALAAINLVFVPCINPDGHELRRANNRPNQRGPEEMGFRTNGVRANINRDFVKADTPEMAAVLGVVRERDPIVLVDLHTTDGAKFEHDIAVLVAPEAPRADGLDRAASTLSGHMQARLTALGHLPVSFYPSFEVDDDPSSGFSVGDSEPRYSQVYSSVRSRLGMLVEMHSWRPYRHRAQTAYHALQALLERARVDAPAWRAAADAAARGDTELAGQDLVVKWANGPHTTTLAFRGYAYERRPSEISGNTWITYDETKPQIWNIPLLDTVVPEVTVHVPREGYLVDGGFAAIVAPVLERHGIHYTRVAGQPTLDVDVYRASKVAFEPPFEGRTRTTTVGAWTHETRTLDQGAIFIPIHQSLPRLIVHLCDPQAPDSFVQWGFLAGAFEKKEYMEAYVAEQVARAQLARDPGLRAQFDAALAADPALAASAANRLEWFYRRDPSWDERYMMVPIYRTDRVPQLAR